MTESESASAQQQNIVEGFECMFKAEEGTPPSTVFDHRMEIVDVATVPVERYISEEFHRLEVECVWPKVWQVVGWAEDIRTPGDTLVYDCAGISAVVVRQRDGSIKAFHNSCLHRGMRLCNETGNRCNPVPVSQFHLGTERRLPLRSGRLGFPADRKVALQPA